MKRNPQLRLLSLIMAAVMALGLLPAASAAPVGLRWKKSDVEVSPDLTDRLVQSELHTPDTRKPTDMVRVSIILEEKPTLMAGYGTAGIGSNTDARAYDRSLQRSQQDMAAAISRHALGGRALDVVWNLTLAANIISANVPYGALEAIRDVPGVRDVVPERSYQPDVLEPNTSSSSGMTGSSLLWETGLTGAGTRIAVVDTGTDTDHQSFDNSAFLHALGDQASTLDLLDAEEISAVLPLLNVTERIGYTDGSAYYLNEKLPFGANYVDRDLTVDHDHDYQGSHGSHVAGIAAANRFLPAGDSFVSAQDTVGMSGMAPDAQILTMKVFGSADGPFDSDYFAAIEDAIWLGCDSINLSLGSGSPGHSENRLFADLLDFMATTDTVVVMSAGNSGHWAEHTATGHLYSDGVSFHTAGSPGTYTNSLAVASVDNSGDPGSCAMSAFSSWGVPGSLELKPEITAPGGSIYSVDGMDPSGTGYEIMSGTSMAAPHITGMAALLAQHIRAKGLDQKTGLSVRRLTQSLLMSTAVPLFDADGAYVSLLSQGAGLGRADLAAASESYVLVEGMADGKVKAELGEDPDRKGLFRFSFTIHDLSGREQIYTLSADLFTQDVFDSGEAMCLDTRTRSLDAEAAFSGDHVEQEASDGFACDLNGDSVTDVHDADHLLEFLLGNVPSLHQGGDVDGDGDVDSHDAHVLLTRLCGSYSVTVPANGEATVDVTLALTEETKALLGEQYPTGAYIEAFVFAEPEDGVAHSIPVLGYYGSWTEPSMYDAGSWLEYDYGLDTRTPYLFDYNGNQHNYLTVDYGDGKEYLFGGNPYVDEAEYLPRRNAFCSAGDAMLMDLRYTLIRNARASMLLLEDADTGEVLLAQELGELEGAYYLTNLGSWQNYQSRQALGLGLDGIPEGTTLNLSFIAAPELSCIYNDAANTYTADWDSLAEGAYLPTTFTIDNTAPELKNTELIDGTTLRITARDNEYIAAAALLNASGTDTLAAAPANQTEPGREITFDLDLSGTFGSRFLLALYDYAGNSQVYELTLDLTGIRPAFTAYSRSEPGYVGLDADGSSLKLAPAGSRSTAQAVEYVEGMVYEVTDELELYLASDDDLFAFTYLRDLDPDNQWKIAAFHDLAYDRTSRTLYGLFYSHLNEMDYPYLCTIDLYDGRMTVLGEMPVDVISLAIDGAGNFYSAAHGFSRLYTYRSDVIKTQKATLVGQLSGYRTTENTSMAWDHNTDELYWSVTTRTASTLVKVDPKTAAAAYVATFSFPANSLYIAYEPDEAVFAPVDTVEAVTVTPTASTLVSNTVQLTARLWPWNVSDSTVIWTSNAPEIASVDADGRVLGVSKGEAVITAASRLDPSKKASCTVTVSSLEQELKAVIWDEEGTVWWSSFSPGTIPDYTKHASTDLPFNATMMANGNLYASTFNISTGESSLYRIDVDNGYHGTRIGTSSISYMDMAYSPSLDYGLGVYSGYVVVIDLNTGDYIGAWEWTESMTADLVGITYYGTEWNEVYQANMDWFLLLDADGNVYLDAWMQPANSEPGHFKDPVSGFVTNIGEGVDYSYFQGFHFDGSHVYWTRFNNDADDVVELIVWDSENTGNVYSMGHFSEKTWPVGGLYTDSQLSGSRKLADKALTAACVCSADFLTEIPAEPTSSAELTDGTVTLDITLPAPVPNTMLQISYDPALLELNGVTGKSEVFAWNAGSGAVRIAAASRNTMSEATTLRLRPLGEGETLLTVTTTELGAERVLLEEPIRITLPHICPSESFVDVKPGNWWHEAVDYVVSRGYMNGMDAAHYGPGSTMNRAQFVTVLYRMEGQPAVNNTGVFADVPANQFYTNAAYWALSAGITTGATPTTFNPGGQLTRTELVTFMYRYAKYKGYDVSATADLGLYRDEGQVLSFALEPWRWGVTHGIISGMTADTLAPMSLTNRAQAAIIFQRFDTKLAN